jgi:hypothetical protein
LQQRIAILKCLLLEFQKPILLAHEEENKDYTIDNSRKQNFINKLDVIT